MIDTESLKLLDALSGYDNTCLDEFLRDSLPLHHPGEDFGMN